MTSSIAIGLAAVLAAATGISAQSASRADSLLAASDTNGAIAAYEAAIKKNLRDTEAHYRAGRLYMSRFVPGARVSAERRKAEEHFRYATRFAADSAKYWLALAELFRTEGDVTTRLQVPKYIDRAREAARKFGGPALAWVEYRAGQIEWERYEQLGHRHFMVGTAMLLDPVTLMDDWRKAENFVNNQITPDPGDPGSVERGAAEEHLKAALSANPRLVDAAGLLVVSMSDGDRWVEANDIARRLVRAVPDSGRAHALLGLTLARRGRWREAHAAFQRALPLMTPGQRASYVNLGLILRRTEEPRFAAMTPAERAGLDSLYWLAAQPLFLDDVNEPRIEFYARLTYVIHRWSDAARGYQGYESDRGMVYVRYGPPDVWATLGKGRVNQGLPAGSEAPEAVLDAQGLLENERNTILWVYRGSQLRFVFSLTPGFTRTAFGGDFMAFYREASDVKPVRFDNIPVLRDLDTIAVQVAQFRADTGAGTDVAVFAAAPIGRMAAASGPAEIQLVAAAIVKDSQLNDVRRARTDEKIRGGDTLQVDRRSWRLALTPNEYLLRVETQLPALERAARSTARLDVRSFGGDTLLLSDIVVARQVTPRDSNPARWTDFFIDPSGGRFRPGQPIALLWEIYDLQPDSAGVAHYRVNILFTVREIERRGFLVRLPGTIADAVGLSSRGDDKVNLSFAKDVVLRPGGRHVEHLLVELENAVEATYDIVVSVTDLRTGRVATAERPIAVTRTVLKR